MPEEAGDADDDHGCSSAYARICLLLQGAHWHGALSLAATAIRLSRDGLNSVGDRPADGARQDLGKSSYLLQIILQRVDGVIQNHPHLESKGRALQTNSAN